jgi:hypothetical protein
MNTSAHNGSGPGEFESTLRMIAHLPAPDGLAERVQAGLQTAARSRRARIFHWPSVPRIENGWMQSSLVRSAAAAAIVAVVFGGGWSLYSRYEPAQPSSAIALPTRGAGQSGQGGFSSAGAMRTPQTLNGPVVAIPATAAAQTEKAAAKAQLRRGKTTAAKKAVTQSATPTASPQN